QAPTVRSANTGKGKSHLTGPDLASLERDSARNAELLLSVRTPVLDQRDRGSRVLVELGVDEKSAVGSDVVLPALLLLPAAARDARAEQHLRRARGKLVLRYGNRGCHHRPRRVYPIEFPTVRVPGGKRSAVCGYLPRIPRRVALFRLKEAPRV